MAGITENDLKRIIRDAIKPQVDRIVCELEAVAAALALPQQLKEEEEDNGG